ncbi:MAG: hypothetical protein K8E24_002470, partial [Methanobacterium paludis]|nr:hypothetical protein [Methanobacterium paludis]
MKAYYEDGNGLPYFSEMDSYYNYRMTADFIAYGHLGETKINGTDWDTLSYAPEGRSAEYSPLIVYLTAFVYKVANLFAKVPLTAVAFWMAAFIASLCVIPAYLFIRRLTNDYGGIVAALLVGLAPFYFSHTFAGFFDTDMFNILLPLLVAWFFVESVRAKEIKNRAIFAVLSAVSLLLFSMAWEGWWYIFYILIAAVVIYLPVSRYLFNIKAKPLSEYPNKKEWFLDQHEIFSLAVFLVLGSILIILVSGWSGFVGALTGSVSITQLQSAVTAGTSYPNVFVSVGEMQVPTLDAAIAGVGGIAPIVFAILGVFLLFWQLKPKTEKKENKPKKSGKKSSKRKNKSKRNRKAKENEGTKENENKINGPISGKNRKNYLFYGILLSLWLIIIAYALTKGQRFGEPFAIPVALSAGIFVGFVATYVKEHVANQGYRYIITALVVIIAVYSPIVSDYSVASSIVPGTDDSMVASLSWINQNTSNDTVITSWWDYGHLFTAVADRPVTFDGGSQTGARAYWVGKALLTNNETLSAGILKMLSTSGDQGYLTLENYTKDTGKSTEILNNILGVDKATAQTILTTQYGLTTDQAQNVLKYTHPDNPTPDVLITSSDMIVKAVWWSYFGSWNFTSNNGTASGYSMAQANATTVNNTTVRSAEYPPLIVYLTAFAYKAVNVFTKVPLTAVAFWMAAFIASLCVIPAYLFVRRITNDYGGIVAALLVGLAPFYFSHTFAGFFDTDMFNIIFPILVVWFFAESIHAKNLKNRTIFAVLSAVSMFLFSLAWEGWWYVFYLVIGTVIVYLLVSRYLFNLKNKPLSEYPNKKEWFMDQHEILPLAVFVVISSVLIILVWGWTGFVGTLTSSISVTQLQATVAAGTSYPNVYVSVSEMQVPTLSAVIAGVGGIAPFVFAILGAFLLFWQLKPKTEKKEKKPRSSKKSSKRKHKSNRNRKAKLKENENKENNNRINGSVTGEYKKKYLFYGVLFSLWLIILAFALTKGERFGEPFSLPIALTAGIFVG